MSGSQWVEFAGIVLAFVTMAGNVYLAVRGNPEVKEALGLAQRGADQAVRIAAMLDGRFQQSQSTLQSLIDKI
jgi:hypothetical protein